MNKWLNTNAALKCWLLFIIGLAISGYPVEYAILLGALGGLAGGFISSWWTIKDEEVQPPANADKVIGLMKTARKSIEGQLGLSSDSKRTKESQAPRMGVFRVRDPNRPRQ